MDYLVNRAKTRIKQTIQEGVVKLGYPSVKVSVEHPKAESFGDLATNTAMVLAARLSQPPDQVAGKLVEYLKNTDLTDLMSVTFHPPGFINFRLKTPILIDELGVILKLSSEYGSARSDQKVLIDYSSPNIAKRFSIGHLRSTLIGQALANIYQFLGMRVVADNHLGDWGTQFGVIIAAVKRYGLKIDKLSIKEMEAVYVKYSQEMAEDESLKEQAQAAFARLEKGDSEAKRIWSQAVKISMQEFNQIYQQLETLQFSPVFSPKIQQANPIKYVTYGESYYEKIMPRILETTKQTGVAKLDKGALVIKFEDNLTPAILLKSDGATTYLTRDLATIWFRESRSDLRSDLYIYEVGAEQSLHFKQLFSIVKLLGWCQQARLVHVAHGMVRLPEGKMSTRRGRTVKVEDLIDRIDQKALSLITNPQIKGLEKSRLSHQVGLGALKYNELKRTPSSNYVFNWDEALNLESNSGPYLQYTYARTQSLLDKAGRPSIEPTPAWAKVQLNQIDLALLRWLYRFPEVIEQAGAQFAPNLLTEYLNILAGRFNTFYNQNPVIKAPQPVKDLRLALTDATGHIIRLGLGLLGIQAPVRM